MHSRRDFIANGFKALIGGTVLSKLIKQEPKKKRFIIPDIHAGDMIKTQAHIDYKLLERIGYKIGVDEMRALENLWINGV